MIAAEVFIEAARRRGFALYAGVPCSYLKPFINYVIDAPSLRYVGAANEGDAVAIAAGAELAGTRSVVMFQNSGLGNAVNPLTSLTHTFRIPVLVIVTLRGEPGGAPDEPQHELMGAITTAMLDLMQVRWEFFPVDEADIDAVLERATAWMQAEQRPFALVMRKGSVAPVALRTGSTARQPAVFACPPTPPQAQRNEILRAVQSAVSDGAVVVATTGYTGRELFACADRPNQLYMVGSMGCAVSLGLGIAMVRPDRRVIVLDGDGAALMRLGAQSVVGHERPPNLVHILLDNGVHESTGGQATLSRAVDFCALAAASGYATVQRLASPDELAAAIEAPVAGPLFIHVPMLPGVPEGLPRPTMTPAEVGKRFREFLQHESDPHP